MTVAPANIVVTRPEDENGPLTRLLREAGQHVLHWPATTIAPPEDPTPLKDSVRNIEHYDWVVFSSANAVDAVVELKPAAPRRTKIAAVGTATHKRLLGSGWPVDLIPRDASADHLARALLALQPPPRRVLFPASAIALPTLPRQLRKGGVEVDQVEAYRNLIPVGSVAPWHQALNNRVVDAVTFTSPSAVTGLRTALTEPYFTKIEGLVVSAIGETTAEALRRSGLTVTTVASRSTLEELAAATLAALAARTTAPKGLTK